MSDNLSVMQTQTVHLCSKLANGTPILERHRPIGRQLAPGGSTHQKRVIGTCRNGCSLTANHVTTVTYYKSVSAVSRPYPQVEFQQQQ